MGNIPLREFRFEIRGVIGEENVEKSEELLKWALRDWVKEVESVEIFPIYNG